MTEGLIKLYPVFNFGLLHVTMSKCFELIAFNVISGFDIYIPLIEMYSSLAVNARAKDHLVELLS